MFACEVECWVMYHRMGSCRRTSLDDVTSGGGFIVEGGLLGCMNLAPIFVKPISASSTFLFELAGGT